MKRKEQEPREASEGLEALLVDISGCVTDPRELARIIEDARDAATQGQSDLSDYVRQTEDLLRKDYSILEDFAMMLLTGFMPEYEKGSLPEKCAYTQGAEYKNLREGEDPYKILIRTKSGKSVLVKCSADGEDTRYHTDPETSEHISPDRELTDTFGARFVFNTEQGARDFRRKVWNLPGVEVVEFEQKLGGKSGEYFADHLIIEYTSRGKTLTMELQLMTREMHKTTAKDRYHDDEKYDLSKLARKPHLLAQKYECEGESKRQKQYRAIAA
ncbi:TPA: hypothetical protein HA265_03630 [Candidatus Woesearchaeota archaeon]|nr:hypothetical protein [Candidatus Woesearchaeota archaeon]